MLRLLCLSICAMTAASDLNTSAFHVQHITADKGVSLCVRNIISGIVENDGFIVDVILINIDNVVEIHKLHGIRLARFITRSFSWTRSKLYNRIYVTSFADFEEFIIGMEKAMTDKTFNTLANFIIVMESFEDNERSKMSDFLVYNNIYNVTILARDADEHGYKIYTFRSPIRPCKPRKRLVPVSHCSNYTGGRHIFPKMDVIRGCRFRLLTYNFYPLINMDNKDEEGVEQRTMQNFEKYADVQVQLVPYSKIDKLGRLVGNFTYTEILTKVLKNEYDGAIGGYFVSVDGIGKFSYSYPLTVDHIVAIMPRSNFVETWQALFQKALYAVILIIFLFIFFSISAYFMSLFPAQHSDAIRDILIVYGYFLNKITLHKFKPGIPETLITCSLLFSVFIIPFTMQALMCSIMTHPVRGYEAKEFEEVQQYGKLVIPTDWMRAGLAKYRKDCESRLDCLMQVRDKENKSHYTLIADELYETYKWMLADKQCNLLLYKIKEPVATLLRTFYVRRGSVLIRPFDKFFMRVMGAGLVDHHYKEIIFRERLKCKPQYISNAVSLKLKDFKVSFNLLIGGLCVSAVSFFYEIITRKG